MYENPSCLPKKEEKTPKEGQLQNDCCLRHGAPIIFWKSTIHMEFNPLSARIFTVFRHFDIFDVY